MISVRRLSVLLVILLLFTCLVVLSAQAAAPSAEMTSGPLDMDRLTLAPPVQPIPPIGAPLPRIDCPEGYEAFVYATDLTSPHGLAFDPQGTLHVAEEYPGRVSRVRPDGSVSPVVTGLTRPQGIDFDPAGNLYIVEDVQNGRLLRVAPDGGQNVLAGNLDAPEGVAWSPDEHLYVTESNVQFAENLPWDVLTRVTRVRQDGDVTEVVTDTVLWSYSAIALGADDLLYVANEASNVATSDSIFRVDPATGTRTLFASDLTTPEGLGFSPGGQFPLYVTEEDLGDKNGRLSIVSAGGTHEPLCTGFSTVEDVAVDGRGNLYVSEDSTGVIVQIVSPDLMAPAPPQSLELDPPDWTATNSFTLTWENPVDPSGIAGAYLKVGAPPAFITDGAFYAGEGAAQTAGVTVGGPGAHPAYLWLEDGAGHTDPANAVQTTLRYDPHPPASPVDLAVEPGDWNPANDFSLTWTNPPEVSGVMSACYRLGAAPVEAADADGCQVGAGIDRLSGVTVVESGQHPVYLWLVDAAKNVDLSTAVSETLHHDGVPPESTTSAPATADTAPIRVPWTATDAHSGVGAVSLWVKTGDGGAWTDSGLLSPADGAGYFLYPPGGEGIYYFATVAVDRAGNVEAEPTGSGDARTVSQTWQRAYLPLLWRESP